MKKNIPLNERIIVALDFPDISTAIELVKKIGSKTGFFKVGLELFLDSGWHVVEAIHKAGYKVMLDLKFFDIPQTVQNAVSQVAKRPVFFTTVHGNEGIIRAANEKKGDELKVLAVTVLTSFDNRDMKEYGFQCNVEQLVISRAKKAVELGCDGIVASAKEVGMLRKELGDDFIIVTPGIRPVSSSLNDQKRVATPYEAIKNGADYLVIGRPITRSDDPIGQISAIQREIKMALEELSG